jgi:hypothetical protein
MSLVNPKSAEDLASALEKHSFDGQVLSVGTVKSFVETIKYSEGTVAHMVYAEVKGSLSEKGFREFLDLLGVAFEQFELYSGRDCIGDTMYRHCAEGDAYCNPAVCHGN